MRRQMWHLGHRAEHVVKVRAAKRTRKCFEHGLAEIRQSQPDHFVSIGGGIGAFAIRQYPRIDRDFRKHQIRSPRHSVDKIFVNGGASTLWIDTAILKTDLDSHVASITPDINTTGAAHRNGRVIEQIVPPFRIVRVDE